MGGSVNFEGGPWQVMEELFGLLRGRRRRGLYAVVGKRRDSDEKNM